MTGYFKIKKIKIKTLSSHIPSDQIYKCNYWKLKFKIKLAYEYKKLIKKNKIKNNIKEVKSWKIKNLTKYLKYIANFIFC